MAPQVHWLIRAQDRLEETLAATFCKDRGAAEEPHAAMITGQRGRECLATAYSALVAKLEPIVKGTFPNAVSVIVLDLFQGYRADKDCLVLRVEASEKAEGTDEIRPHAYIVKVAYTFKPEGATTGTEAEGAQNGQTAEVQTHPRETAEQKLKKELKGWEACERRGNDRGRIFMKVHPGMASKNGSGYASIKYEDAHQVLRAAEIMTLERAVLDACQWGRPPAESVEDVIAQIFKEMNDRFYRRSWSERPGKASWVYLQKRIDKGLAAWTDGKREAGRAAADALAALTEKQYEFLNPCDYVKTAWRNTQSMPEIQRGCAHGDLNGRNVFVGMVDGQAKWPAVFDYEDMRCDNYLAWDFVKLEFELKVRALRQILGKSEAEYVRAVYHFEEALGRRTEELNNARSWERGMGIESKAVDGDEESHGAEPVAENAGHEASTVDHTVPKGNTRDSEEATDSKEEAATKEPEVGNGKVHEGSGDAVTGIEALGRILLGIRRMAKECLEVHRGRNRRWLDEYYFLLTCYGIQAGRFPTYQWRELLAAFTTSGVAAYRYAFRNGLAETYMEEAKACAQNAFLSEDLHLRPKPIEKFMSFGYRAQLCFASELARSGKPAFVSEAKGMLAELRVKYRWVAEIGIELTFALLEMGSMAANTGIAESYRMEAQRLLAELESQFGGSDKELMDRLGRLWKDRGDEALKAFKKDKSETWKKFYTQARNAYAREYDITGAYYPGINVATLCWLVGEKDRAQKTATDVLAGIEEAGVLGFWEHATKGEAYLLLGDIENAKISYTKACADPACTLQAKTSMKKQVNRILKDSPVKGIKTGSLDPVFK